jgi:prepilin-type N-terminal cleavage/methylation domain-containing protein
MNRGFTLLEVLIALAVLSISMLGVYRLSAMSVDVSDYATRKAESVEAGYQRILEEMNYPGKLFKDKEEREDGTQIVYKEESTPTMFPGVDEKSVTTTINGASSVYIYYEKQ